MRRSLLLLIILGLCAWTALPSLAYDSSSPPSDYLEGDPDLADFNGDGFGDLAIGVPFESTEAASEAGAVNVLYGSVEGLQADLPDDQLWTQESPGVKDRAEPLDVFGSVIAMGDFNADGFTDLAAGVPNETVRDVFFAGAVNVLYGSADGLQADSPDDQFWSQDSPGIREHAEPYDLFGNSLAVGDFNGDGHDDLAIGSQETVGGFDFAGAVNVLYGSADGLQADSPDDQVWSQDSPGVKDQAEGDFTDGIYDLFGQAVAAGDFNADGFADLAIGVPNESGRDVAQLFGAVSVLYGSLGGLQADGPDDQLWTQDSPGVKERSEDDDELGESLASGDFNADGFSDLAAGTDEHEGNSIPGAVMVLYGSPQGLQADAPDDQVWDQDSPDVEGSMSGDEEFGSFLASGDFDADGFADLAIAAPLDRESGVFYSGAVSVLYGSGQGLQAIDPDDQLWTQDSPGVKDSAESNDVFGGSMAGGDFDGNGFADLAIGVPREGTLDMFTVGMVNVLYGSPSGLESSAMEGWNQDSPGVMGRAGADEEFGWALAAQ